MTTATFNLIWRILLTALLVHLALAVLWCACWYGEFAPGWAIFPLLCTGAAYMGGAAFGVMAIWEKST